MLPSWSNHGGRGNWIAWFSKSGSWASPPELKWGHHHQSIEFQKQQVHRGWMCAGKHKKRYPLKKVFPTLKYNTSTFIFLQVTPNTFSSNRITIANRIIEYWFWKSLGLYLIHLPIQWGTTVPAKHHPYLSKHLQRQLRFDSCKFHPPLDSSSAQFHETPLWLLKFCFHFVLQSSSFWISLWLCQPFLKWHFRLPHHPWNSFYFIHVRSQIFWRLKWTVKLIRIFST